MGIPLKYLASWFKVIAKIIAKLKERRFQVWLTLHFPRKHYRTIIQRSNSWVGAMTPCWVMNSIADAKESPQMYKKLAIKHIIILYSNFLSCKGALCLIICEKGERAPCAPGSYVYATLKNLIYYTNERKINAQCDVMSIKHFNGEIEYFIT